MRAEQGGDLLRRGLRTPRRFEFGAPGIARQLQLPTRDGLLDPAAQRASAAREAARRCVVVGRGEHARLERFARELWHREIAARLKLYLAFERLAHVFDRRSPLGHPGGEARPSTSRARICDAASSDVRPALIELHMS